MAKIVIIAPSDADVKDAVKLLKGDGHDVDIEEPTPKSLLHIVLGLLGPNAYGFGSSYSVGSAAVPPSEEEDDVPPEDAAPEDEGADVVDDGDDDFHFEALELGQVKVDGELIDAVSHDAENSVLIVEELTIGPKTTYTLNESTCSFWPADQTKPMLRVDVGAGKWHTSVELEVRLGEKQELQVGKDLLNLFEPVLSEALVGNKLYKAIVKQLDDKKLETFKNALARKEAVGVSKKSTTEPLTDEEIDAWMTAWAKKNGVTLK